jgi:hypothetical protein
LKIVFSFGLAATSSSAPTSSRPAPAPAPAPGSAAPAVGKAISWMFRRDCMVAGVQYVRCWKKEELWGCCFWGGGGYFTLRSVTRSEAWRSVRADMSSTSLCSAGSEGDGVGVEVEIGDGGGNDDDGVEVVASAVAVASARVKGLRAETLCVASVMLEGKACGNK